MRRYLRLPVVFLSLIFFMSSFPQGILADDFAAAEEAVEAENPTEKASDVTADEDTDARITSEEVSDIASDTEDISEAVSEEVEIPEEALPAEDENTEDPEDPVESDFVGLSEASEDVEGSGEYVLELSEKEEDAQSNFTIFENALHSGDGIHPLTITFPQNGTFYFETPGGSSSKRALIIASGTTIDLNGSTILRTGKLINQNFFQNADENFGQTAGGYSLSHDITIKNGTIDGNVSDNAKACNLINFGHATGVRLQDLVIKNGYKTHLVELTGCADCVITGCTFTEIASKEEVLQLDICKDNDKASWNGKYTLDGTACKNITVQNCKFLNVYSGVGNHHTLTGKSNKCSNIKIINNSFTNSDSKFSGIAIRCYGFVDSLVQGNTIQGYYEEGISFSGGNVDIRDNIIDTKSAKDSCGIYIYQSFSHQASEKITKQENRVNEYVTAGIISGNTIRNFKKCGISVNSGSALTEITSNKIRSGSGMAIYISASTVTGKVSDNTISGISGSKSGHGIYVTASKLSGAIHKNHISNCAGYGINLSAKTTAAAITSNVIHQVKGDGIYVTGSTVKGKIASNSIKNVARYSSKNNCAGNGIYITGSTCIKAVQGNTITDCSGFGVFAASKSKVAGFSSNTVTSVKGSAIMISDSTVSGSINKNKITKVKKYNAAFPGDGIYVNAVSTAKTITNNTIKGCAGYGLVHYATKSGLKITGNKFSGNKGGKLIVRGSGKIQKK